jgi:hypothetical protein
MFGWHPDIGYGAQQPAGGNAFSGAEEDSQGAGALAVQYLQEEI